MTVFWAHVDDLGNIITRGQCADYDLDHQEVPAGLVMVRRPEYVTEAGGWKYINNSWQQIEGE